MKYFYFIKADIAYMYLLNEYAQKKRFPLWKTQKILLNYCTMYGVISSNILI